MSYLSLIVAITYNLSYVLHRAHSSYSYDYLARHSELTELRANRVAIRPNCDQSKLLAVWFASRPSCEQTELRSVRIASCLVCELYGLRAVRFAGSLILLHLPHSLWLRSVAALQLDATHRSSR